MAQAIGYVTKVKNGGFDGTLAMMSLKKRIRILPNIDKKTKKQPDFRVYTEDQIEIGGGWKRTGKTSGKAYISLTFAAPELGPRKIYANLGQASGQDDKDVWQSCGTPKFKYNQIFPHARMGEYSKITHEFSNITIRTYRF